MNCGRYRLVFNRLRGIWMAVSEISRAVQPGSGNRRQRLTAATFILLLNGHVAAVFAGDIAVDALPDLGVKVGPNTVIHAPVINPDNIAGRLMVIQQGDLKAILEGPRFNIGSASEVKFNHLGGAGSATLVRVNGNDRSIIEGKLTSPNGDLYLINQNGILFGDGARVNVHGLVGSTLNLSDSDFLSALGHLNAIKDNRAAYIFEGDATGFAEALVQVAPDAKIQAALGGSVMLFGSKVINQGSIKTEEGQVAMAGGSKVYLSYAPDPNTTDGATSTYSYAADSPYRSLAGLLVEVDPYQEKDSGGNVTTELTGEVVNDTMGRILAERGNVTMTSFLVNQSGRVTATTSVNQKGSIRLLARDQSTTAYTTAYDQNGTESQQPIIAGKRTGELVIGQNSVTMILPEHAAGAALAKQTLSKAQVGEPVAKAGEESYLKSVMNALSGNKATITDEQDFSAPTLEAIGRTVTIKDNAKVIVPGGHISISAQKDGTTFNDTATNADDGSRVYLGKNTLIDASGLKNVAVDSDRNFIKVLLTQNDLKDDPLNKNGFLYRKNVWVDIRDLPESQVADLDGYLKQVPRDIGEKLATAGTVKIKSEGDVVQRTGSKIDVSGGSLKFSAGNTKESWLVDAAGNAYAIGDAPVGTKFTGFLAGKAYQSTSEAAYTEGKSAGAISINTFGLATDGEFKGSATYGQYQRTTDNLGGSLIIGNANGYKGTEIYKLKSVEIAKDVAALDEASNESTVLPDSRKNTVVIDGDMLSKGGFGKLSVYSEGGIKVDSNVSVSSGGSINLTAQKIDVNADLIARGGAVNLVTGMTSASSNVADSTIKVSKDSTIDVSGLWVNDYLVNGVPTARVLSKGGSIKVSAMSDVTLEKGSLLDVSGGAWAKTNGTVTGGNAGSIAISAQTGQDISTGYRYVAPEIAGELRGYSLARGGSLAITAPFVTIGSTGFGDAREYVANSAFFSKGGFTSYSLTGRDGVVVREGTKVNVSAKNYFLDNDALLKSSGGHVHDISSIVQLPDYLRYATSLSLGTQYTNGAAPYQVALGSLVVEKGSSLSVDGRASLSDNTVPTIALSAWQNQLYVDGTLRTPGGNINLTMNGDPGRPNPTGDNGYVDSQAIWLGSNAKLITNGYTSYQLNNGSGLREGTVFDAGNITLNAKKGYIVTEQGSMMSANGSAGVMDVLGRTGYQSIKVASQAGNINLTAREGMLIDGGFSAKSPSGLGGSLNVSLGRGASTFIDDVLSVYPGTVNNNPNQQWFVSVSQSGSSTTGLNPGDAIASSAPGLAKITADNIKNGGFASLALKSEHGVRFDGDVDLNLNRTIEIDARVIEATAAANVNLQASYIKLSNTDVNMRPSSGFTALTPAAGDAKIGFDADLIDLRGNLALSGFTESKFTSAGDIRLTGYSASSTTPSGSLLTQGDMAFTARQIYPTSLSTYTLQSLGSDRKISFAGNSKPNTVLSAAGTLNVKADYIEQGGVLKAPFGVINLQAAKELTLKKDSITSVSGKGALVPFGYTDQDGQDYLYDYGTGTVKITAAPEKVVNLTGPSVNQESGSVVDVSGGGDLYAFEWVAGTGGSADVLANGADQAAFGSDAKATWAVIPSMKQAYGSYDSQYWQGSDIQAGDTVYLAGGGGLAAGYYTLLPARYALLPGAYLVSALSSHQDMVAGQVEKRMDGSTVVAGHLAAYTQSGYVQTDRSGGFAVRAGKAARDLAEYTSTKGSVKFTDSSSQRLGDAGRLAISADQNLVLQGILRSQTEAGMRGAEVDIAAPKIAVKKNGAVDVAGYLNIDEKTLSDLNAYSLMLGGTRSSNGQGQNVNVTSGQVLVADDATIKGPEVILVAKDEVRLNSGSQVLGSGTAASGKNLTIGSDTVSGDGALLRVASSSAVKLIRNNISRAEGSLVLENGSVANGEGAVQMDATSTTNIQGDLALNDNATLGISAGRISLGSPLSGQVVDGLSLSGSLLDRLSQINSLSLTSYSTIDFYGGVNLGSANQNISLNSAGLAWYENAGLTSSITAKNLTLDNVSNVSFVMASALSNNVVPVLGSGSLEVNAATITTGNNSFRLAGLSQSSLQSSGEIVATGNGTLASSGDLTLGAKRITAEGSVTQNYIAEKALTIIQTATNDLTGKHSTAGATLNFNGSSIAHQGTVDLASGNVNMSAAGAQATDGVTLATGAVINATGSSYSLNGQTVAQSAGTVTLKSANGDINLDSGSQIKLSSAAGGDAGKLDLQAKNGKVELQGTVSALQVADAKGNKGNGAEVSVDSKTINSFSNLLGKLADFSGAQTYRVRTGDVTIAAADSVKTANFNLGADAGSINVAGKIDASGDKGGSINLYAANDLTVASGAQLLAVGQADKTSNAGTQGRGGDMTLAANSGTLTLDADSVLDVSGDDVGSVKGADGLVTLRASRISSTGIKVADGSLAAIKGAREVTAEAVKVYESTTLNTALLNTINTDNTALNANASAITTALGKTQDGLSARLAGGAEVRSSNGDITVANNIALTGNGVLTLRAKNNINVNNNVISQQYSGFGSSSAATANNWSMRFNAGSDFNAANIETANSGNGDINIAASKQVFTGTGFIHMNAGNDINLGSNAAVFSTGTPNNTGLNGTQFQLPNDTLEFYGNNGGDIKLAAQGDVTGAATTAQTANRWFYRGGQRLTTGAYANPQVRWWSRFDKLQNIFGALGGGDVTVNAAGSVSNMQFAAASNARVTGDRNTAVDMANFFEQGGGDVLVKAGVDVTNALLFASKGQAGAYAGNTLDAKFELMDASATAHSVQNLTVSMANPTVVAPIDRSRSQYSFYFYSYGKDGKLNALSSAGDVTLNGELYPSSLYAAAPDGNVTAGNLVMYPSATGSVTLLAKNDISTKLVMSDVDPNSIPQVSTAPVYSLDSLQTTDSAGIKSLALAAYVGSAAHTAGNLHQSDSEPARFYAGHDVIFAPFNKVIIPKKTEVIAGNDIVNPNIIIQNLSVKDISLIKAGGHIRYSEPTRDALGQIFAVVAGIQVAGPGRLHLEAGKDIDFGSSDGLRSVGNLYNPYLAEVGATMMIKPGTSANVDYAAMIRAYLDPATAGSMSATYLTQLVEYMKTMGADSNISKTEALAAFKQLSVQEQTGFINTVFYQEIRAISDSIKSGSKDYSRPLRAILLMFPDFTSNTALASQGGNITKAFEAIKKEDIKTPGDLKLFYSQIRSESSGDIEILVPGGYVNAGLAVSGTLLKPATDLGIVSIRGGDINAFVRDNFQVNQSRVFTLGGSDLMLFSALANIDAGKGAKTSSATPPPVLRIRNGQIYFDYSSAVSGSGIAALTATGGEPGRVGLFAPFGVVDAGEAGIRSAGTLEIVGPLIGGQGVQAAGGVSGGTTVSSGSVAITAPTTADPSSTTKSSAQPNAMAMNTDSKNSFLPSFITVEVLGFGLDKPTSTNGSVSTTPTNGTTENSPPANGDNKNKKTKPEVDQII